MSNSVPQNGRLSCKPPRFLLVMASLGIYKQTDGVMTSGALASLDREMAPEVHRNPAPAVMN